MSQTRGIEWTDATWQTITAAKRIGMSVSEYLHRKNHAEKWCTKCKEWHRIERFGIDRHRGDGLSARCLLSGRVAQHKVRRKRSRGWIAQTRDGDKKQARRRINYLVEQHLIPHPEEFPCMDCGDEVFARPYRHEYDHARGYDGENQLYVEAVCSKCHHNREELRHGKAA